MAEGKQQRKEMDVGMSRGRNREIQKLIEETTEKLWRGFFSFPFAGRAIFAHCLKSEGKEFLYKRENTEDKVRTLRDWEGRRRRALLLILNTLTLLRPYFFKTSF